MKTITKNCSFKQAEAYQNKLYCMYDYVRLVSAPMVSEKGLFIWEVK